MSRINISRPIDNWSRHVGKVKLHEMATISDGDLAWFPDCAPAETLTEPRRLERKISQLLKERKKMTIVA